MTQSEDKKKALLYSHGVYTRFSSALSSSGHRLRQHICIGDSSPGKIG